MKRKRNSAEIGSQDKRPLIAGLVLEMAAPALPKAYLSAEIRWTQTAHKRSVDTQLSQIASAAYYLSEARGFTPGHEEQDWHQAPIQIDAFDSGIN